MGDNLLEVDLGSSFEPIQIKAGYYHTCALSTTNTVKCWGRNWRGALGYGDTNDRGDVANTMGDDLLEIDLGSSFMAIQITVGGEATCALSTTNTVKCWGKNDDGALGLGDTTNRGDVANTMGDNLLEVDLGSSFTPAEIIA
eukprot:128060_1